MSEPSLLDELLASAISEDDLAAALALISEVETQSTAAGESRFIVPTLAEVADFFGMAAQSVREWRSNGMPGEEGRWDLREITRWRIGKLNRHAVSEGDISERALRRQREALKIESTQLDLAKKKGELIDKTQALADMAEACAEIATRLQALPAEMAASEAADVRDIKLAEWKEKINLALKSLEQLGHDR